MSKNHQHTLFGVVDLEGIKNNCKKDITFSLEYLDWVTNQVNWQPNLK